MPGRRCEPTGELVSEQEEVISGFVTWAGLSLLGHLKQGLNLPATTQEEGMVSGQVYGSSGVNCWKSASGFRLLEPGQ